MSSRTKNSLDDFAGWWVDQTSRRPWWTIVLTLLLACGLSSGARLLEFSNNYRVFFSAENPELIAFEDFQATYTKSDNILFVVRPQDGEIFTPETAAAIEQLTHDAWQIPYATRVDSISNFQHTWSEGDDLTVEDLIRDAELLSPAELAEKQAVALAEPLIVNNLLSPGADTTGINITLQYPEESLEEIPSAVAYARGLARDLEASVPVTVALSGVSMLNNAFSEAGERDAATLMPLMFLALTLFMILVLRSVTGSISTLSVVAFSAACALGAAGYAGIQLTPVSVTAPVIIMTLAIADSVHILVSMLAFMREGESKRSALRESMRVNFLAVLITSLTTAVGFLALNFSDAPPFRDLGNITAIGIVAALFFSTTLLPALLIVLPMKVPTGRTTANRMQLAFESYSRWLTSHHRTVLITSGTVAVALAALAPLIDLNDQWVRYFDDRVEFRRDSDFASEYLGGVYRVEFSIPAGEPEGISDPIYLETLERFARWLREQPEVSHVYSYSDIVKRLNKNLHGDDPSWYRIPDDRALAAQYLLLYELSLPFGLDLNDRINVDKSATRVTATIADVPTRQTREFLTRAEGWIRDHAPPRMHTRATGANVMFSYISERNIKSMLRGNVLAVVLIAAIMTVALGSLKLGALSLIPNTVPILMSFGIWSLLVGKVGMAAATVSASSLGIIVDDTVHFLTKYRRGRYQNGLDRPAAVRYAFRLVGVAIASTTVILTTGFLVLSLSTFRINFELGALTALAIVLALIADITLLPALLLWGTRPDEKEKTKHDPALVRAS